ncbi:hypothetical protein [Streptomyces nigrescens]|uniref:hypothetical protein n=1 Tax=Streptomyces nigrescens TaxID=1920 RepID=UPI00370241D8
MSIDTFIPESVFRVVENGDILRRSRGLHPRAQALKSLADVEAAAETSGLLLENAYRKHQQNLDRVDRARQALMLAEITHPQICPPPIPFVATAAKDDKKPSPQPAQDLQVIKTHPAQPDLLEGLARITRTNLRYDTKSAGMLTMACGRNISWIAAASYTDAMHQLFGGAPVVVRGFFDDKDRLFITLIRAASREEWDVPDAGQEHLMLLGQDTVAVAARIRKGLLDLYGPTCQECGAAVSKSSAAALQDEDRLRLVCHPCKAQRKATAGRAEKAVA